MLRIFQWLDSTAAIASSILIYKTFYHKVISNIENVHIEMLYGTMGTGIKEFFSDKKQYEFAKYLANTIL